MSGVVEVTTDTLRQHAARVQNVVDDVSQARVAAGTADLHGGAFGVLCSFLPPAISGVDGAAREALDAIHEALVGTVSELQDMARSFDDVDQRAESTFRSLGRALAQ